MKRFRYKFRVPSFDFDALTVICVSIFLSHDVFSGYVKSIHSLNDKKVGITVAKKTDSLRCRFQSAFIFTGSSLPPFLKAGIYLVFSKLAFVFLFIGVAYLASLWVQMRKIIRENKKLREAIDSKSKSLQEVFQNLDAINKQNIHMMHVASYDMKGCLESIRDGMIHLLRGIREGEISDTLILTKQSCVESLEMIDTIMFDFSENVHTKERIDLKHFLERSVMLLQESANEKSQRIELSATSEFVFADIHQLRRAINNIIMNAIKFSQEFAVIYVRLEKIIDWCRITIQDNGKGMPPEIQSQIFKTDKVFGTAGTAGEPSFGLGLFIVKKIIEQNKGKVYFDSTLGKGTTFYIELLAEG